MTDGRRGAKVPLVLMYHALGDRTGVQDPHNLFVPAESFQVQLQVISHRGLRVVSLDQYLSGDTRAGDVLLTFDDAYVSTLNLAAPMLAQRGWPATVFVSSSTVGRASDWNATTHEALLDVDGLLELMRHGWSVGAHGRTHTDLRGLSPERLDAEMSGSRDDLRDMLGKAPSAFAYPYGLHDLDSRRAVEAAGFAVGFAVYGGAGRFAVPRVDVNALDTPRFFRAKLHRSYPALRRALGVVPPLRRAAHLVSGVARR